MVDKTISKEDTAILKGLAIIMMVSVHIMTISWMSNCVRIWDIQIYNMPLATVLSDIFNYCVSIFAFISGYAWGREWPVPKLQRRQYYKKCIRRIIKLYIVYWIILIGINFPIYEAENYVRYGVWKIPDISEIAGSILAVSSEISKFNWYISFFAIAVITYPFLKSILDRILGFPYLKIALIILGFLALRFAFRKLYGFNLIDENILSFTSRYFTTMPILLIGTIVYQNNLYGKMISSLKQRNRIAISCVILFAVSIGKFFMHYVVKNTSNLDSFIIIFVMFAIVNIIHEIDKNSDAISKQMVKLLKWLGKYSLYTWLIHSVFVSDIIQPFTYFMHLPILIICEVFIFSFPFAWIIHKLVSKKK